MFDSLKNNIGFNFIKKAISDKDGNINIKSERYYNTLMITFLQAKNELVYNETGINLFSIDDIEEVYYWSEEFCKYFFIVECIDISDALLCPWCHLYSIITNFTEPSVVNKNIIDSIRPECGSCTYGKRHGFCSKECNKKYESVASISGYCKVLNKLNENDSSCKIDGYRSYYYKRIDGTPGMRELYTAYRCLVKLRLKRLDS